MIIFLYFCGLEQTNQILNTLLINKKNQNYEKAITFCCSCFFDCNGC